MPLKNTMKRASTKAPKVKTEKKSFEKAYIIEAEVGDKIVNTLAELPIKYSSFIGPIIDHLQKGIRADVTINVPVGPPQPLPTMPEVKKED